MNAEPSRWRRWAVTLAQHAACVMPGARSPWADAMRRELDYIGDDPAALRWALGCILASYRARLTHRRAATVWRYVASSGAVLLVIGLGIQANAGGQSQLARPSPDGTTCHLPNASSQHGLVTPAACECGHDHAEPGSGRAIPPHDTASLEPPCCGTKVTDHPAQASDPPCSDRLAPIHFLPLPREADDSVN